MNARLGLDKLVLLLPVSEVEISPDFPATVENPVNAATGEPLDARTLYVAGGRAITGRVAHFNTKNYQVSVSPARACVRERASASAPSFSVCTVQFSAGAFSESNLEPLDRDRCMDAAAAVQRDLAENGVLLDLQRARLARLDIAQNVALAYPVACYAPALAALGARKRTRKMDFGGTGFIVGNKQWEIGFYDKGEQMKVKGYAQELRPVNTVRPELRLLKGRVVKQSLASETLPDLRRAWPELPRVYGEFMRRDVFRAKLEHSKRASIDEHRLAAVVLDSGERRLWQRFKSEYGLLSMVQDLGVDLAKNFAATELGIDRSTETGRRQIDRIHGELDCAAFALKVQGTSTEGHQVLALYEELKERVLAA